MSDELIANHPCADAAAGVLCSLSGGKRNATENFVDPSAKKQRIELLDSSTCTFTMTTIHSFATSFPGESPTVSEEAFASSAPCKLKTVSLSDCSDVNKKHLNRLEQNRRAAKVSRERKKLMLDELQQNVSLFDKANTTLKAQNEELIRLLALAKAQVDRIEDRTNVQRSRELPVFTHTEDFSETLASDYPKFHLCGAQVSPDEAEAVAALAGCEFRSFPSISSPSQLINISLSTDTPVKPSKGYHDVEMIADDKSVDSDLTNMQTGATMHAMAKFQHAASAAMRAAMQSMEKMSVLPKAEPVEISERSTSEEAFPILPHNMYMNNMVACAMYQSFMAAAMSGEPNHALYPASLPLMMGQFLSWQQQQ